MITKLLLSLPLVLIAAWAVYEKGNPKSRLQKGWVMGLYGACIAVILLPWAEASLIPGAFMTVALLLGLSLGLGNAVGPAISGTIPNKKNKEAWQFGPLLNNVWLSLAGLGFFRAVFVPVFFLVSSQTEYLFESLWLVACSTAAAPLAMFVVLKKLGGPITNPAPAPTLEWERQTAISNEMWVWQDRLYGALVGLSAIAIGVL